MIFADYFFSDRDKETSHVTMLKVLLRQILEQNSDFLYQYFHEFNLNRGFGRDWTFRSLINVISSLTGNPDQARKTIYLLIDAFDESENHNDEREELVKTLQQLCTDKGSCTIKIFITSRPVNELPDTDFVHSFDLQDHTKPDILLYTKSVLDSFPLNQADRNTVVTRISKRAEGVFVWVYFLGKQLRKFNKTGATMREILGEIERLPANLENIYQRILDEICSRPTEEWDARDVAFAKRLFSIVLFSKRPLRVDELRHILAAEVHMRSNNDHTFLDGANMFGRTAIKKRIIHCGKNLIEFGGYEGPSRAKDGTVDDIFGAQTIQLMHQTVRSFFLGPRVLASLSIQEKTGHRELANAGLHYLKTLCSGSNISAGNDGPTDDECVDLVRYIEKWVWASHVLLCLPDYLSSVDPDGETKKCLSDLESLVKQDKALSILLRDWISTNEILQRIFPVALQGSNSSNKPLQGDFVARKLSNQLLAVASRLGHPIVAEFLLHCGAEIETRVQSDDQTRTPLQWAVSSGQSSTVQFLLENGANIREKDGLGNDSLILASIAGCASVMRLLLERANVNPDSKDNHSRTPLSWAAGNGHEAVVRLLLERPDVNPNPTDDRSRTPLSWAAKNGHKAVVRLLLDRPGVNSNAKDNHSRTPLSWAAENCHDAVVRLLLERLDVDANLNAKNGQTPFSYAAENGHEAVLRLLLRRPDVEPNLKDNHSRTPLFWAAGNGHEAVVRLLLDRPGVHADSIDMNGQTPLSYAAKNGHEAVVRLLLDRPNVNPNSKDKNCQTPLARAAENGHETVMRVLLDRPGVDPNSNDNYSRTPLSWAAKNGHEAVVRLLLERPDVDADSKSKNGQTPLSCAAENGHQSVVRLLLERSDVDADSKDNYDYTPVSCAAENGHDVVVRLLLERPDVDADSKDNYSRTPLSCASENGHEAVVKLLMELPDVDADSKDSHSRTPLSWAAENGHEAVVRLLLGRPGVDPNSKDLSGRTPLSKAVKKGHEAVWQLLVDKLRIYSNVRDDPGILPGSW